MKKVLIGVGIGCGVLVLLGIIAMGAAGYWFKKNLGGAMEAGQQASAQAQDLKALNQQYAFTAPPEGEVLALQESRLNDYFAVRDMALPVFKEFEAQGQELSKKTQNGEKPSVSDVMQATNLATQFVVKVRASYIDGLKQHKMSPREFTSITGAIYNSHLANAVGASKKAMAEVRESAKKSLADVEAKLQADNLSEEDRSALEAQRDAFQAQVDSADDQASDGIEVSEKSQAVAAANVKLLEKYKDRVEKGDNAGFDALIVADGEKNPFGTLGTQSQGE